MKPATITLAVLLGIAGVASAAEKAQPVTATLILPHAKILPGVPFDMVVRLHNTSSKPVTVGLLVRLHVTDAEGNVVLAADDRVDGQISNGGGLQPFEYGYAVVSPGESTERVIDWQYSIPKWSRYPQIARPGTYDLSLELMRPRDVFEDAVNVIETLRTTTARLERVVPAGEDAEIWKRMQEASNGRWTGFDFTATKAGFAIAEEIVRMHPASQYYPYALILTAMNAVAKKDDIPLLREAARRFVDSPAHAHLLKRAGDIELREALLGRNTGMSQHELERHYERADQYYREALKTNNAAIRPATEEKLRFAKNDRATLQRQ